MRPPKGFENEKFPLRHRLVYKAALTLGGENTNTVLMPLVMASKDTDVLPNTIQVNPHNSAFEEDNGPLCQQMSIIDRMTISIKFNMLNQCENLRETAAGTFTGDSVQSFNFLWRPIFNIFPEKMDAADDDTGTTVAAILALTKDATNEDIVPLTTNNLPVQGTSDLFMPVSTVNAVQVFGDFNMTTDLIMEDHVFDEDLLQTALRRYTNKGALRSCLGRTRHVTLTRNRPFSNFYIDKFVPTAIRRIQPYGFFAIQVHVPQANNAQQHYFGSAPSATLAHLGVSLIANYHEWNFEHDQERGTPS